MSVFFDCCGNDDISVRSLLVYRLLHFGRTFGKFHEKLIVVVDRFASTSPNLYGLRARLCVVVGHHNSAERFEVIFGAANELPVSKIAPRIVSVEFVGGAAEVRNDVLFDAFTELCSYDRAKCEHYNTYSNDAECEEHRVHFTFGGVSI